MWLMEGVIIGGCFKSNELNTSDCLSLFEAQGLATETERLSLFTSHGKPHICLDALNTG